MSEPITIPGGTELIRLLNPEQFEQVLAWMLANDVDPNRITVEYPVTITDEAITRYDVLGNVAAGIVSGYRRDHGHKLRDGEAWTTDDAFAIVCRPVTTAITVPLPSELREAIETALKEARA